MSSLDQAYRNCETLARQSNFYTGLRLLPFEKRRALMAIYAFMRQSDDLSDSEAAASDRSQRFQAWRKILDETLQGRHDDHPSLPALRDAVNRFRIPPLLFHQLIDGTEMDLTISSYATFEDLYRYCYHVASVVGLICLQVFGFDDSRAEACAESCGIAFQLTNILRDIAEDLERDRIYLPREDMARFQYSEADLKSRLNDSRFQALMIFQCQRARRYYELARPLVNMLERDSRPCFWAMFRSYETILQHLESNRFKVFEKRCRLKSTDKLKILGQALGKRIFS